MIVDGAVLPLDRANIDTDQIIPARFLTGVTRDGLGAHCFEGLPGADELLRQFDGATIIATRENFGCGSSREHAAWALADRGFRAVVATSFARIFEENAYANGIAPVTACAAAAAAALSAERVAIDLQDQRLVVPGRGEWEFPMDPLRKRFLLEGGFLDYLAGRIEAIRAWERVSR